MIARLLSTSTPVAIAHRGGALLRPENTLAAFAHAVALGVDAIECDVQRSRDGDAVVIHDATLDRTSDVSGPVSAFTADELGRADAGYHFDPEGGFPFRGQGHGVVPLATLVARWPELPIVVELKGQDTRLAHRVIDLIGETGAASRVIIGGFSAQMLAIVRECRPDLVTSASKPEVQSALRRAWFRLAPRATGYRLFQVPVALRGRQVLTRGFVHTLHRAHVPVHAWVVNDDVEMRRLLEWGVTGLISDRPDRAVDAVRRCSTLDA